MFNGTYERIKIFCDTLPLNASTSLSRSTVHLQWSCHSRSLALSFEVPLRYYLRCLALLFEVLYCAAIRGPLRTKSKTKFFKFRRFFSSLLTKMSNITPHYFPKYEIWAIEKNCGTLPLIFMYSIYLLQSYLIHGSTFSSQMIFNLSVVSVCQYSRVFFHICGWFRVYFFIFAEDRIFWRDEQMNTAWEVKIINMINLSNNQFNLISDADEKTTMFLHF